MSSRPISSRVRPLLVCAALLSLALVQSGVGGATSADSGVGSSAAERAYDAREVARDRGLVRPLIPAERSPQILNNFEVVGHLELGGRASDADVQYFDHGAAVGQFAYVGTWADVCVGRGVKIVDVSDPAAPERVAVAGLDLQDVSYEDPVVMSVGARTVLAVGVQICGPQLREHFPQLFRR